MAEFPHVRIGDYWFRLAEGLDETGLLGLHPMQRRWQSIFAERQGIPGDPGIQNVRADDLRWAQTSWAQGEGQRVIDATSSESFRAFDRSNAIDLSVPGQLQLAKAMAQQGLTGAGAATLEGDTWSDDIGTSTVVNTTDRRLNAANDAVKVNSAALAAASWQFDIYAYLEAANTYLGSSLLEVTPKVTTVGATARLSKGAVAGTGNHSPPPGDVNIDVYMSFSQPGLPHKSATWRVKVIDHGDGSTVLSREFTTQMESRDPGFVNDQRSVTFTAHGGHTYRYRVQNVDEDSGVVTYVSQLVVDPQERKQVTWQIKQGVTVIASGVKTLTSRTTAKIASATIVSPGATVYTVRVSWTDGSSSRPIVDKALYEQVTLHDPRTIELGYADKTWLVDHSAGQSVALYWDPQNAKWVAVGTFGAAGSKAIAMAHSDNYEFVGMDDKIVYRIQNPATAQQYSAASADPLVGIAVGGNRLFVLTENVANGTTLFDAPLEGAPNVALTSRDVVGNLGRNADTDETQRIAGTENGAVYFANNGPDCIVRRYDGSTGTFFARLPTGFRGAAIVYGNGFTWIGGNFPAPDSDGTIRRRPALFVIDSSGVPSELASSLWRDDDPSTRVRAMQLYGTDLWVLTEVAASPKTMRMWRVSLITFGAFLEQEITTDETQAAGAARGLAVNFLDRIAIWSAGNPYLQGTDYATSGESSLTSSRYTFSLSEQKELISLDVAGLIPTGTAVDLYYAADDGALTLAGTFLAPGRQLVSAPNGHAFFSTLRIKTVLRSTDPALTPTVYSVLTRAYLQTYDRAFELILQCFDQLATEHITGQQVAGSVGIDYLFALADGGGIVEFEDRYSSKVDADTDIVPVSIADPQAIFVRRGEAYVKVGLTERGT